MKYIEAPEVAGKPTLARLELTRRNLETLLEKLDDPLSQRMLIDPSDRIVVTAVENDEHYRDRKPGEVYMPSTGQTK